MIYRSKLYLKTIEKDFSQELRLKISKIIRDTKDELKDEKAKEILDIVNEIQSETELIQKLNHKELIV